MVFTHLEQAYVKRTDHTFFCSFELLIYIFLRQWSAIEIFLKDLSFSNCLVVFFRLKSNPCIWNWIFLNFLIKSLTRFSNIRIFVVEWIFWRVSLIFKFIHSVIQNQLYIIHKIERKTDLLGKNSIELAMLTCCKDCCVLILNFAISRRIPSISQIICFQNPW